MEYVRVKIKDIVRDTDMGYCCRIILQDMEDGVSVPMVVSSLDARPLIAWFEKTPRKRPHTHDFFYEFLSRTGHILRRVNITRFERGVFHAVAVFDDFEKTFELDCRPTDGLILAVKAEAPIFIATEIIDRIGSILHKAGSPLSPGQRLRLLEKKLQTLIAEERYEDAARVRDQIDGLKAGTN